MKIALPYHFDTTSVWHIIMKWAFALNAVLLFGIALKLFTGDWPTAIGIAVSEALVFGFTRLFLHYQSGSFGTLYRDCVEVEPNALLGVPLPGPQGVYARERFSAVRVEFSAGPINVDGPSGGPNELVWLVEEKNAPHVITL